jgi:hypothetical protein
MKSDQKNREVTRFQKLSYQEQLGTVWQKGILLEARQIPGFWLNLYAMDAIFVEVWICQHKFEITLLRCFSNPDELEPYLVNFSIDGIIQNL